MLELSTDFFELPEALINEVDEALRFFARIRPTMWTSKHPGACIDEDFLKHNAVGSKVRAFFSEVAEEKVRRGQHPQKAVKWRDVETSLMFFDELLTSIFYGGKEIGFKHPNRRGAQADLEREIMRARVCGVAHRGKRTTR